MRRPLAPGSHNDWDADRRRSDGFTPAMTSTAATVRRSEALRGHPTVDFTSPRRLCDCVMCTTHYLYLSHADYTATEAWETHLMSLRLPLALQPSSSAVRRHLADIVAQKPDRALVACSCDSCPAHWCLVHAYRHAAALGPPARSDDSHRGRGEVLRPAVETKRHSRRGH